jgi:hypothetical protein
MCPCRPELCPAYGEWVAQWNGPVNADITPMVQGYLLSQKAFVETGDCFFKSIRGLSGRGRSGRDWQKRHPASALSGD